MEYISMRINALFKMGDHVRAVAEASELANKKGATGNELYDCACIYSLASATVKLDEKNTQSGESALLKEQYAIRAVELLSQGFAKGFKDVDHMKKDTDLDPLRQRPDFQKLMAEFEKSGTNNSQKTRNRTPE